MHKRLLTTVAALALTAAFAGPSQAQQAVPTRDFDVYVDLPTGFAFIKCPSGWKFIRKLDAEQLRDLLDAAGLTAIDVHGLHHGARIEEWESTRGIGLVEAQIAALRGDDDGVPDLAELVGSVTVEDFVVGGADGAQDLIAVAVSAVAP